MKTLVAILAAIGISALLSYTVLSIAVRHERLPTVRPSGEAIFAVGGLIPAAQISGGEATIARLAAAHCSSSGTGVYPAKTNALSGAASWERGSPAAVICPGADTIRREVIAGYWVVCEGVRASLYFRLGRGDLKELAGCLVVAGAGTPALINPDDVREAVGGRRVKAAFRAAGKTYAWTDPDDEVVPVDVLSPRAASSRAMR